MIVLFSQYFTHRSPRRNSEFDMCLKKNLANSNIGKIVLFNETSVAFPKSRIISVSSKRMTYSEMFCYVNSITKDSDVNIISNNDIWFDGTAALFERIKAGQCYALSRSEVVRNGGSKRIEPHWNSGSQDVWAFRGKINCPAADYFQGVPGCDNKIAYDLEQSGYVLKNYCKSITCYHEHSSGVRDYLLLPRRPIVGNMSRVLPERMP